MQVKLFIRDFCPNLLQFLPFSLDTSDWVVLAEIMRKHINEDNILAVVSEYVCNVTLRQQCPISAQVNNILNKNVGGKISFEDWQMFGQVGANIGQDLLVAGSTAKVLRSVSNEFDEHVHSLLLLVTFRASHHNSPPWPS